MSDERGKNLLFNHMSAMPHWIRCLYSFISGGWTTRFYQTLSPIRFLHSSDVLFPSADGLSVMQIIMLSRLMDTELWLQGEPFYWNTRLSCITDNEYIKLCDCQYSKWLESIIKNGFCPAISGCWDLAHTPSLALVNGGTHRFGYVLSQQKNTWLPVRLLSKHYTNPDHRNGLYYFAQQGISDFELGLLLQRYKRLSRQTRRMCSGFMDYDIFSRQSEAIKEIFARYCSQFHLEAVYELHQYSLKKLRMSRPLRFRRHDFDLIWNLATMIEKRRTTAVILMKFELNYQEMYYKGGTIRSYVIDRLSADLRKEFGQCWGYLAGTVSESVLMESCFYEQKANL